MKGNFLTMYKGKYTVEIHSRTNSIGVPLQYSRTTDKSSTNIMRIRVNDFDHDGLFRNNSQRSIFYDSKYWQKKVIQIEGTYL